ncbi:MAG: DUF4330 domain-containing protein [Oscillospiraceae bacterium]
MKVVDEKGKLFGKINIIDLLVIILVIAAIALVGWKVIGNRGGVIGTTTGITYVAVAPEVAPEVYEEICTYVNRAEGKKDQLMANGDLLNGYVVDVTAAPHVNYEPDAAGKVTASIEEGPNARLDLTFTIEAQVANPTVNKIGTQEVRVGKGHIVKTAHFELEKSQIISCDTAE